MSKDSVTVKNLKAGLRYVGKQLASVRRDAPFVVAIAGVSASGKTTLCAMLHEKFPDSAVISLDGYFHGKAYMEQHGITSFDDPRAVNLALAADHLTALKSGRSIQKPRYSFVTGEPEQDTDIIEPARFIFIEGLYALCEPIYSAADLSIFVDSDVHGTLWRRIVRDVQRTGKTAQEIVAVFIGHVHPENAEFVLPSREHADIIVINNMLPDELRSRLGKQYQQKMFVALYDEAERRRIAGILASAGFYESERLTQRDTWLVPPSKRDVSEDELIRVREETPFNGAGDKRFTLTYKSPASGVERALFQLPITVEIRNGLVWLGYRRGRRLIKERTIYRADGRQDEIALDLIRSIDGDQLFHLYLEVRSDSARGLEECVGMLCDRGLQQRRFTSATYRDLNGVAPGFTFGASS